MDDIDKIILTQLGKNSRVSAKKITKILESFGHVFTDRAIRKRITRLEKQGMIVGYSTILNPNYLSEKVNRTIILKFKFKKDTPNLVNRLKNYVKESSFCTYSSKLNGDFDWILHFVFNSVDQYELETNNFLNKFSDLISDYRSYESDLIKLSPYMFYDEQDIVEKKSQVYEILNTIKKYDNLNERLQSIVENLVKYFNAKFARIWFLDKKKENLILKFSAGKYKRIDGTFSKIPLNSLKIGTVATTKKPVVSNDVIHDPRIKHHDWAKKEKLKSFAGYPILYHGDILAVLGMFSTKKFSPADFELLGIFSSQLSKELSGFFETQDFLSK